MKRERERGEWRERAGTGARRGGKSEGRGRKVRREERGMREERKEGGATEKWGREREGEERGEKKDRPARTPGCACVCRAVKEPFHMLPFANLDESGQAHNEPKTLHRGSFARFPTRGGTSAAPVVICYNCNGLPM